MKYSYLWLFFYLITGIQCLRDVRIIVPRLVTPGSDVTLLCLYDLQRAPLYSVKWYRGSGEFYRFVPEELPPGGAFPLPGINVELSTSNAHQVTLLAIPEFIAGEFRCEVTTDSPYFNTAVVSAIVHIGQPELTDDLSTSENPIQYMRSSSSNKNAPNLCLLAIFIIIFLLSNF